MRFPIVILILLWVSGIQTQSASDLRRRKWINLNVPVPAPAAPAAGPALPACATVQGCTTATTPQCATPAAGGAMICDMTAAGLAACHWPIPDATCAPVTGQANCNCAPGTVAALQPCATVQGCTTATTPQCAAPAAGGDMICDMTAAGLATCHWPIPDATCAPVTGQANCNCAPGTVATLPPCATVQGCFTGTTTQCVTPAAGGDMICDMTGAGLMACTWPPPDATCTPVANQANCDCAPGTLADCTTEQGCFAGGTTTQCVTPPGGTAICDMAGAGLMACNWPAAGTPPTCTVTPVGQMDCDCAPGTLPVCMTVQGCTAATATQCTDTGTTGTETCLETAPPGDLAACTWPAAGAPVSCSGQVGGQADCLCAPGPG